MAGGVTTSFANWDVLGVDPAPSKQTVVFDGTAFRKWRASEVVGEVRRARKGSRSLLIAWDAPMSFSPARGFSDRAVDKGTRAWLKEAFGASCGVNALPFSQCPHWAITSAALGVPTGDGFASRVVRPAATLTGTFAIEVHPAVTLAWWWFTANKASSCLVRCLPRVKSKVVVG